MGSPLLTSLDTAAAILGLEARIMYDSIIIAFRFFISTKLESKWLSGQTK